MSIIQNLPQTTLAYQRKYGDPTTLSYLGGLSPAVRNSLAQFDLDRVNRGGRPLGERETLLATQAAEQQRAMTPERDRGGIGGFFGDVLGDANAILGSVLHIPSGLYNEVKSLPDLPGMLQETLSESEGPLDAISKVAALPGFRFLPGAFIAENITNPSELLKHPLFTALDVLPGAKALGAKTAVGKAAMEQGARGPLRALATRTLDEQGQLVPNRVGRVTGEVGQRVSTTRPGQLVSSMFGQEARAVARLESEHTARVRSYLDPEGKLPDDAPELARAVRKNAQIAGEFDEAGLPKSRQSEIIEEIQLNPERMAEYSDLELGFVNRFQEMNDVAASYGIKDGELAEVILGDTPEIVDVATAKKLHRARRREAHLTSFATARTFNSGIANGTAKYIDIWNHIQDIKRADNLPLAQRKAVLEGDLVALRAGNFIDQATYRTELSRLRRATSASLPDWRVGADNLTDSVPSAVTRLTDNLAKTNDVLGFKSPKLRVDRLRRAVQNGDFATARKLAVGMKNSKLYAELPIQDIIDDISALRQQQKFMASTTKYTDTKAQRAQELAKGREQQAVPARFQSKVDEKFEELVEGKIREIYSTDPKLDEYLQLAKERNYPLISGLTDRDLRILQRQAKATWTDLKRAGFDPVFVHRVRPGAAKALPYSRITDRPMTPTQVRQRMGDLSSFSSDASVILSHQGMEWLVKKGSEAFVEEMGAKFGRPRAEVMKDYIDLARKRAGDSPRAVQEELTKLIEKEWVTFPPDKMKGYGRVRASATTPAQQTLIPKNVATVMNQLYDAPLQGLSAVTDPVMNVFRTSLLPLSPRWHIYNILGGGVTLLARTDPRVFKHLKAARKMVKEGELPQGAGGGGFVSAPADFAEYAAKGKTLDAVLGKLDEKSRVAVAANVAGGATLRRLWDQAQWVRDGSGKLIKKSYDWNQKVDDMYRAMAYLYGNDRAVMKGMTKGAAHDAGISLVRKVMQNWDEMTPMERSIMRTVFPFYGWMSHIAKYVLTYPIDHPVRASVMSNFARNELEDHGTGLPRQFAQLFYWGDMDDEGNVTAINMGGANPFADVANYFTVAGFTSNASPLIGMALRMTGVDTSTGTAELYPTLRYDPETGRMIAERPNAAVTAVESLIPQTRLLTNMTGMSTELRDLMAHNPDSARRYLQSTLGLPVPNREVNIPEEYFKTELRRDREQREVFSDALRTGDFSAAREYPGLRALIDQVEVLRGTGQLEQFTPPDDSPGYMALLRQAATLGIAD